jgi:hypothetical protein
LEETAFGGEGAVDIALETDSALHVSAVRAYVLDPTVCGELLARVID